MKKLSVILLVLVLIIALAVLITSIVFRHSAPSVPTKIFEHPTTEATAVPMPEPSFGNDTAPATDPSTEPIIETVGESVTVNILGIRPGALIDRTMGVAQESPEYIADMTAYVGSEGKVYKNDRTISIEYLDEVSGKYLTYSFGYATGEYNRFLYLNPKIEDAKDGYNYYFHFSAQQGSLVNIAYEDYELYDSFSVRRALNQDAPATYIDPTHPGLVWFTAAPIDEPVSIDVIAWGQDSIRAIFRLWIEKDDDGCYYISSIENRNLIQEPNSQYDIAELYYIYEMASADIHDGEKLRMTVITDGYPPIENYIIDYRSIDEGCYYRYFVPAEGRFTADTLEYRYNPMIAVTLRTLGGGLSLTLYYHIIHPPKDGVHGVYQYIGRDYPLNDTIENLQMLGYPGMD
ncbi:MAG TPA: hypothetical protein IAC31_07905 [Candidatus Faecousia intestinigallinarum]|nr:hypothetical protein [Candidatus Faecousia intestinigallinarum]